MTLLLLIILALLGHAVLVELERGERSLPGAAVITTCRGCGGSVAADWLLCPSCSTRLRHACGRCGKMMAAHHRFCAHCGQPGGQG